jgi:hypothetical protein
MKLGSQFGGVTPAMVRALKNYVCLNKGASYIASDWHVERQFKPSEMLVLMNDSL